MNTSYIHFSTPMTTNVPHITDLFKALGDETRLRILWALMSSEMCVGEIADYITMTKSAVSHQLRELRMVNLVKIRKDGKKVYYSLKYVHIEEFIESAKEFANL